MQPVLQLPTLREEEHEECELVGRHSFAQEVFLVTLTVIGLFLSLAQVVISLRRK
jgi:hypothetical protein